jgi:glycosyltransferase involved in cell wall biosynthesis
MNHVLHICSDYSKQTLYRELIIELSKKGIKQTVYVPVRSLSEVGKYDIAGIENVKVIYSHILFFKHRLLYQVKIKTIFTDIEKKVNLKNIEIVHAHFLFSDGGVAYKIKAKYSIPYIVAIRNTDVNVFFKYMLHLRAFGREIIKASRKIVFITPAYQSLLVERYVLGKFSNRVIDASIVPNGLSPVWLEESMFNCAQTLVPLKLLYVGDFSRNKNVIKLLKVIKNFSQRMDVELTLAGGGGNDHESLLNLLQRKEFKFAKYIGRVEGIPAMKQLYSQHHIFIMISKLETFGLVYLEAMSQGLPVVHTAGQGIDGYFNNSRFAIPVNPNSEKDVMNAIESILNNYEIASREARKASKSFLWDEIAISYFKIYNLQLN